ncbi:MAG: esterase family protein [Chitinophagaceae bacterium]|nr:esterase family protein [Chitinophagaceae bacterium]
MMKKTTLFLASLFAFVALYAQSGTLRENYVIESKILGKPVKFAVYMPAAAKEDWRKYPVLYLLHGYTDDETGWPQFGEVQHIADKQITDGKATPMIIVMPDGGVSFYLNSYDGKTRYEDFFVQELIPHIDANFPTRPKKEFRAIAGLSMGGFGSLLLSMKHPDLFTAAAPLSAAVISDKEISTMPDANWNMLWGSLFGKDLKGNDRLNKHWYENSILKIAETKSVDELKKVSYYIDCGDDDFLIKGNMDLHALLTDRKVPHEFRVRDGGHTWSYWRTALPEVLRFVSDKFHR